jgi:putative ABC transport system permease protein
MFENYWKIAVRNLVRNKTNSVINILGLSLGIAVFIFIMLFVKKEYNYDRFNEHLDRIYRVQLEGDAHLPEIIGRDIAVNIPEVSEVARIDQFDKIPVSYNDKTILVDNFVFADSTVFNVFTFPFVQGNPKDALDEPYEIVLTENTAQLLFGKENPINKIVKYGTWQPCRITGIIKDVKNSHLQIDAIGSFETLTRMNNGGNLGFSTWRYFTYILVPDEHNSSVIQQKISSYFNERYFKDKKLSFNLVKLKDVYFTDSGRRPVVFIYLSVAILILIIACINSVNLTTASASKRVKEIGIKKVIGSQRWRLILQFLGESVLSGFIAVVIALFILKFLLPLSQYLFSVDLNLRFSNVFSNSLLIAAFAIAIGVISGIYPALYLSAFTPLSIFRKFKTGDKNGMTLRTNLILFQFVVAIILISSTFIVEKQLGYLENKDLGFDKELVITIPLDPNNALKQVEQKRIFLKDKLLQNPAILNVTYSDIVPGQYNLGNRQYLNYLNGDTLEIQTSAIDPDYINVMGLKIIKGRDFDGHLQSDQKHKIIINEEAVRLLKLPESQSPIGTVLSSDQDYEIIGIVKNFHQRSLRNKIEPLVYYWEPHTITSYSGMMSIKISAHNINNTIGYIHKQWDDIAQYPFMYTFLDDLFNKQYTMEINLAKTFGYFTLLAIFIANLGLFGLSLFIIERKRKEIGIRRVNGAKVSEILAMLNKDFIKWVVIAFIIAVPIAWYTLEKWLENFAYKTEISWWVFALSGIMALGIALLTVSWQSWRAAMRNPVEALRYE